MSAEVISFRPSDADLEEAWEAYDQAQRHVMSLFEDLSATSSRQRMEAALEANRRLLAFRRLATRWDAR